MFGAYWWPFDTCKVEVASGVECRGLGTDAQARIDRELEQVDAHALAGEHAGGVAQGDLLRHHAAQWWHAVAVELRDVVGPR